MLELDSLLIRVAILRTRALELLHDKKLTLESRTNKLKTVAVETRDLDLAFAAWPQGVSEDWKFSIHPSIECSEPTKSELFYEGSVHKYTTRGHAAIWNRYRAVRLILNTMHMRVLSALVQCTSPEPSINAQLEMCQENIGLLATDLCFSVPVFFNVYNMIQDEAGSEPAWIGNNINCPENEIMLKMAAILAWPLTVAVSTEAVPKAQKVWLQHRLKTVASVIGAGVLHSVAENEEFEFYLR